MSMMDEGGNSKVDYVKRLNDCRQYDIDGDLGYTVHINKAMEICRDLECYYLSLLNKVLEKIKE